MIRRLAVCRSPSFDPYRNLALEEALLGRVGEGELILYLWQNEGTVVIGRNQNPWKECRTALLEQEGGHLARRLSGGGAVFHDLGNLNFTFLMTEADYDLDRQLQVLERACQSLGIPALRSGRNDLLVQGRKFSGSAFYKHGGKAYHHGTLMVDVDLDRVQRYLSPSRAKLAAKGVDSVRSRVANLKEFAPGLRVETLAEALIAAAAELYAPGPVLGRPDVGGGALDAPRSPAGPVVLLEPDELDLAPLTEKYRSQAWLYGPKLPFTLETEERFPWGGLELQLQIESGVIQCAKVYTDAMDQTLAPRLEQALNGVSLALPALERALQGLPNNGDLLGLLGSCL